MADRGGEFSFFQGIHERTDTKIDISIFHKIYGYQIWQTGTCKGVDLSDTNQAGTITSSLTSSRQDQVKN